MSYIRPDNWDEPKQLKPLKDTLVRFTENGIKEVIEVQEKSSLPDGMNTNLVWEIDVPRLKSTQCPYRVEDTGMWLCQRLKDLKTDDVRCLRKYCEFEVIKF